MSVERIEFIVEEPSMESALRLLLPRMIDGREFAIYPHNGKDALLRQLPQRLAGYRNRCINDAWFREHCRIIIVIDRDDENCHDLKSRIETITQTSGLASRSRRQGG